MDNILQNEQLTKSTVYHRPGHFASLENMRLRGLLCDVTIEVEHTEFKAHKFLLAATMRYFENMFLNDFEESRKEIITIKDVSATNMQAFITFVYTGQITLTEDNVQSLIIDADYLDLIDIKKECMQFLESCLRTRNVCEVYCIAEYLSCISLKEESKKFMQQHFEDVSLTDSYLNLGFEVLKDILSSDNLQDYSQIKIFKAVMRWITYSINKRTMYLSELLGFIRLSYLSSKFLINYFFEDGSEAKHRELVMEVMSAYKLQQIGLKNDKKYIFLIDKADINSIEIYNPVLDTWVSTTTSNESNSKFSAILSKGKLYTFGGIMNNREDTASAQVYDPKNKIWQRISSMNFKRKSSGAAVLNAFLYVCGGSTNKCDHTNVVERYCPESDKWKTMSSMNCHRDEHPVVTYQGCIYVIGGCNGQHCLNSVERYDPRMNQWTILDSPMKERRSRCGAAVLNEKLYVCGGNSIFGKNLNTTSSVEVYDAETNRWEYVASMNTPRCKLLVVANMGKLWAIGGCDGKNQLLTVEMYDPDSNSWSYAKPMNRIHRWVTGGLICQSWIN